MNIMFIKMEEPKDFGTWLQVAKVRIENMYPLFIEAKFGTVVFYSIAFISVLQDLGS